MIKYHPKIIAIIALLIIFNFEIIFGYCNIGELPLLIYQQLQLILFSVALSLLIKNKIFKIISIFLTNFLFLITAYFYYFTKVNLTYYFLANNIKEAGYVINYHSVIFISLAPIFSLATAFLFNLIFDFKEPTKIIKFKAKVVLIILSTLMLSLFCQPTKYNSSLIIFLKSFYQKDKIIDYYQKEIYQSLINKAKERQKNLNQFKFSENNDPNLDNIIIIQLESLNSDLVNSTNTPNFIELSKKGMFFPKFYGNSVRTINAQENILCSMPPFFGPTLNKQKNDQQITCLPEIFSRNDYKTFFFESYNNLKFDNTEKFMKNIGFKEIHDGDIVINDKIDYAWGVRDDKFYQYSFDYLKKNKDSHNFIYLAISSTNHWPFKIPANEKGSVLFPEPKNFKEKLINTTNLQDNYLQTAVNEINRVFPEKNYTLLILGDHSWPAGAHPENIINLRQGFEENFLTSMIIVPGQTNDNQAKIITNRYSEMDIMPSLLDLFGTNYIKNQYRASFMPELKNGEYSPHKIILVQNMVAAIINIIDYPNKFQYQAEEKKLTQFNLSEDPIEENGEVITDRFKIFK